MLKISEYSSSLFSNPGLIMSFSGTHKSFDTETCETESWKMFGLLFCLRGFPMRQWHKFRSCFLVSQR